MHTIFTVYVAVRKCAYYHKTFLYEIVIKYTYDINNNVYIDIGTSWSKEMGLQQSPIPTNTTLLSKYIQMIFQKYILLFHCIFFVQEPA